MTSGNQPEGVQSDLLCKFSQENSSLQEKEDVMWIIYLVVALVGLVFGVLSFITLEPEA